MTITLFLISLILIILTLPIWPYSKNWSYKPAGILAIIAIIILIFFINSIKSLDIEYENGDINIEIEKKSKR